MDYLSTIHPPPHACWSIQKTQRGLQTCKLADLQTCRLAFAKLYWDFPSLPLSSHVRLMYPHPPWFQLLGWEPSLGYFPASKRKASYRCEVKEMMSWRGQFWCGRLSALVNQALRPPASWSIFCCFPLPTPQVCLDRFNQWTPISFTPRPLVRIWNNMDDPRQVRGTVPPEWQLSLQHSLLSVVL